MIVSITRSALSSSHFWARSMTRARPAKPSASHPGWAAPALATTSLTWSGPRSGTVAMTRPLAGFTTSMSARADAPLVDWAAVVSVVAMASSSSELGRMAKDYGTTSNCTRIQGDRAEVGVAADREARGRPRDGVGMAAVDRVVAERAGVPDPVGPRVVADVRAVARQVARRHRVADVRRLVGVDEAR